MLGPPQPAITLESANWGWQCVVYLLKRWRLYQALEWSKSTRNCRHTVLICCDSSSFILARCLHWLRLYSVLIGVDARVWWIQDMLLSINAFTVNSSVTISRHGHGEWFDYPFFNTWDTAFVHLVSADLFACFFSHGSYQLSCVCRPVVKQNRVVRTSGIGQEQIRRFCYVPVMWL